MILYGKMKDGSAVRIAYTDKGALFPGTRADGTRFEAYTAHVSVICIADSYCIFETYMTIDKSDADASGNAALFRQREEAVEFARFGVDPASLRPYP